MAIGEIGLDFFRDHSPRDQQIQALEAQLALAEELSLPVVVHCREAHDIILPILAEWSQTVRARFSGLIGVMHCFSGGLELAFRYVDLGFMISLAGNITFPKAELAWAVGRGLPLDALLVETDSPYLAAQPKRGRRNEPAYLKYAIEKISELREIDFATVAQQTTANASTLFGLNTHFHPQKIALER